MRHASWPGVVATIGPPSQRGRSVEANRKSPAVATAGLNAVPAATFPVPFICFKSGGKDRSLLTPSLAQNHQGGVSRNGCQFLCAQQPGKRRHDSPGFLKMRPIRLKTMNNL